jgi:ketosteroid isomerase-like protein
MLKPSTILLAFSLVAPGRLVAQPDRPAPAPLPSVALPPELDRVLRDYERQWQARSPSGLAALFAEDGFVLQSGRLPVRGRGGIEQAYSNAGGPLVLRALAFAATDSVGYIIGGYSSRPDSPDIGKFILLLRRELGGPWRIMADMDNGNGPR